MGVTRQKQRIEARNFEFLSLDNARLDSYFKITNWSDATETIHVYANYLYLIGILNVV